MPTSTLLAERRPRVAARAGRTAPGPAPAGTAAARTAGPRAAARWLRDQVRPVPGTLLFLAAVAVTGAIGDQLSAGRLSTVLTEVSTNLANLSTRPIEVMLASAVWDAHPAWWYFGVFLILHGCAERWLGTARWLGVVLAAHVTGTLVSQGWVAYSILTGSMSASMATVHDYGVSYTLAGAVGVLTYAFASRTARWWYAAAVLAVYSMPFWTLSHVGFTDIGHLTAVLVGLAAWPLVRHRDRPIGELVAVPRLAGLPGRPPLRLRVVVGRQD